MYIKTKTQKSEKQINLEREKSFKEDVEYIKQDTIAKQKNGNLCKVSNILKSITVTNMTEERYTRYWVDQYKDSPEKQVVIAQLVKDKLKNGLTPLEEIVEIQKRSKDSKEETDKLLKEILSDNKGNIKEEEE